MILSEFATIKWNQNNKKYYISVGYNFTKIGDIFNVKICDLSHGSHGIILVKCDVCGCEKNMSYKEYYYNIENGGYFSCSRKCGINKKRETVLMRYGVENVSQLESIKRKKEETNIANYGEIFMKYFPKYNPNSIFYLDYISEKTGLKIQHALNGGEKKFIKYWVDGYVEEYNICIEWDERQHKLNKKMLRDEKKDKFLKENYDCHIIRINEKEFLSNIDNQIKIIVNKINNIRHGK